MQVCNEWADKTRLIALKLPVNFNFDQFFNGECICRYEQIERVVLGYHKRMFGKVACDAYVMRKNKLVTRMQHPKMILLIIRAKHT